MGASESTKSYKNASYKLTYFNGRGRGEVIRLCFAAAGKKFTDTRVELAEWPELKAKMPLGFMPLLEVNGVQISQSMTIVRFVAGQFGLRGSDDLEGAKIDEITETVAEFALELTKTFFIEDEQAKKEAINKITEKLIPFNMDYLEKTLKDNKSDSGYLVGRKISVADLAVFNCLETLESVVPSAVQKYPNVRDLGIKVGVNGNVARYVGNRPKTPF